MTFMVGSLIFLATATFPRKETVSGILRYPLGELRIASPRNGIQSPPSCGTGRRSPKATCSPL